MFDRLTKGLKDLVLEEDPQAATPAPATTAATPSLPAPIPPPPPASVPVDVDSIHTEVAIASGYAESDALRKFSEMSDKLRGQIPDESARYAVVFTSLESLTGITRDTVQTQAALAASKAAKAAEDNKKKSVIALAEIDTNLANQLKRSESHIAQLTAALARAQQELANAQESIARLPSEFQSDKAVIASRADTYTSIAAEYQAAWTKIASMK